MCSVSGVVLFVTLIVYLYMCVVHSYRVTAFGQLTGLTKRLRAAIDGGKFDSTFDTEKDASTEKATVSSNGVIDPATVPKTKSAGSGTREGSNEPTKSSTGLIAYTVNQLLECAADRVAHVAGSRLLDVYLITGLIVKISVVCVVFAFLYLALWRADTTSFSGVTDAGVYEFVGFSLSMQFNDALSVVRANDVLSRTVTYAHVICAWGSGIFFSFMLLTTQREKYREDLDVFVAELRAAAGAISERSVLRLKQSMEDIEYLLLAENEVIVTGLRKLRGLEPRPVPRSLDASAATVDSIADVAAPAQSGKKKRRKP